MCSAKEDLSGNKFEHYKDIWNETEDEIETAHREHRIGMSAHHKLGLREGINNAREAAVQTNFNAGFSSGSELALELGLWRGRLAAVSYSAKCGTERETTAKALLKCLDEELVKLSTSNLFTGAQSKEKGAASARVDSNSLLLTSAETNVENDYTNCACTCEKAKDKTVGQSLTNRPSNWDDIFYKCALVCEDS